MEEGEADLGRAGRLQTLTEVCHGVSRLVTVLQLSGWVMVCDSVSRCARVCHSASVCAAVCHTVSYCVSM